MNSVETLLPPNATAQERALEVTTERLADVPVPIAELWNPWTCPPEFLPWLAWALSVDEWRSDWDDTTKRMVIAEQTWPRPPLHQLGLKTTGFDPLKACPSNSGRAPKISSGPT